MSFLSLLYNRFAKTFSNAARAIFVACVVIFLAKVVQSLEGADSIHAKVPESLWKLLQPEFADRMLFWGVIFWRGLQSTNQPGRIFSCTMQKLKTTCIAATLYKDKQLFLVQGKVPSMHV